MKRENKKYILLTITILWGAFILYMSSRNAVESMEDSSLIVDFLINIFSLRIETIDILTTIVRKGAHFSEYFILSLLCLSTYKNFNNHKVNFSFVLLVCNLVALSDEFLQGFIPGRSSEVKDVFIDFAGALTFLIIYRVIKLLSRKKVSLGNVNWN